MNCMEKDIVLHADQEEIVCHVRYGSSRRKRLSILVRRDGRVDVLLPVWCSMADAEKALEARHDWILKHVTCAKARQHLPEGADGFFLGMPYRMDVLRAKSWEGVKLTFEAGADGLHRLVVSARRPEKASVLVRHWFEMRARSIFASRLSILLPTIPWLNFVPPWRVRTLRSRWGSCSVQGHLTLNAKLVQAPERCIDFVILHEIAHIRQLNHSPAFYVELEALLPDWRERRAELNKYPL